MVVVATVSQTPIHSRSIQFMYHHHNRFTALFPGTSGWAGARRKLLLDFMVLGRIKRGRHTNNPGAHHSIQTNQQSTSINLPIFVPDALPDATLPIYAGLWHAQVQQWLQFMYRRSQNQLTSICCWFHPNFSWYVKVDSPPPPSHHNHFMTVSPGPSGRACARRDTSGLMVQGKINRGIHTDRSAGCHSIRTNQCPPPPFPHFLQAGCSFCSPTKCQSTKGRLTPTL